MSWSSERDPFAHSLVDEEEDYEVEEREGDEDEYDKGEGENEGDLEGEHDEDEDESDGGAFVEGSSGSPGDGHTCPFILPSIWTVNDFKPMMTTKIFNNFRDRIKSLITFQSVCLESMKSAILGRPWTSACMMPCLRQD